MLTLTQTETRTDPSKLAAFKAEFASNHTVYIRDFIDQQLLAEIQRHLNVSAFHPNTDHAEAGWVISKEGLCKPENPAARMLWLLLNRTRLFETIQELTGCDPIGCFLGRLYRFTPAENHFDSWHDDCDGNRLIGLSIELGSETYEGGVFELRERESKTVRARVGDKSPGSIHFFRIDPDLQHRVGPLTGTVPRTACAGWFMREPKFHEEFLQ